MTPAASYARYSTDRQSETSCADQHRITRARAEREGLQATAEYSDDQVSGATPMRLREAGARLLADMVAGAYQVLLVEGLDRLARDLVDQETIVRRLEHLGVRIIGVADGYDTRAGSATTRIMHRGMRGIINEVYRHDVATKTHRGLAARHERGLAVSSAPYGYRIEAAADGKRLVVDEQEAVIVREIYARFVAGESPRAIAGDLNVRRVPSPRGGTWCVSAIFGHEGKGCGILQQRLYVGEYVWNRSRWEKDPDTGRRRRIERPPAEWQRAHLPELRILEEETWQKAHARRRRPRREGGAAGKGPAVRWLLSGIVRCGHCGGAIVGVDARRYGCSARKDRGEAVCSQRACVRMELLDAAVLAVVREELSDEQTLQELMQLVREVMRERRHTDPAAELRHRLAGLEREIGHLTDSLARLGWSEAVGQRLQAAESERRELLDCIPPAHPVRGQAALIPRLADVCRAALANLEQHLRADVPRARDALRGLIGQATLVSGAEGLALHLEAPAAPILLAAGDTLLGMVAGARSSSWKRVIPLTSGRAL